MLAPLLALSGALALPATAQAQTETTLVSNIGQSATYHINSEKGFAQSFTTGSNASGYTLTGVDVVSASTTGFTVQVCETATGNGYPTSSDCTALTAPGTFAVGTMSFTAPATTALVQDTTYAVVLIPETAHRRQRLRGGERRGPGEGGDAASSGSEAGVRPQFPEQ